METDTVTIEVLPQVAAILLTIQQKAEARGKTLDAFLRELIEESEAGGIAPAPYELAKEFIGAINSNMPDPSSPPIHTAFGQHLLEEHRRQVSKLK